MSVERAGAVKAGGLRLVDPGEVRQQVAGTTAGASTFVSGSAPSAGAAPAWQANPVALGVRRNYFGNDQVSAEMRDKYLSAVKSHEPDLVAMYGEKKAQEMLGPLLEAIEFGAYPMPAERSTG